MFTWLRGRVLRLWTADTAALLLYNLPTGLFNLFWETLLVGNTKEQWLLIHLAIFTPAKYGFAFVEARFKKYLRQRFQAVKGGTRRKVIDAVSLACYQIPLYLLASWLGGRTGHQLLILLSLSLAEHLAFGQYHGWIMDWCEAKFANGQSASTAQTTEAAID